MKNIFYSPTRSLVPTAFLLLLFPVALLAQISFLPRVDYAVGGFPISVIAADLDGDGDQDLVVVNRDNNNVSVLMNNGDGTFADTVNYPTGADPLKVVASDLDGDGDLDLVVTNAESDNVSVLMNNGNGTFAPKVDYGTGVRPFTVVAADLDGINGPDLAVCNQIESTVSILKNNGNGTFALKVDYGTGYSPHWIIASDLDNDGDQDLVTPNIGDIPATNGTTVSVLANDGSGAFSARFDYTTGTGPAGVFAADLDGDGYRDLAVANDSSNTVSVLRNNGDNAFTDSTFADRVDYATGLGPHAVVAADLDGDGHKDLVVGNWNAYRGIGFTVSVLRNKGDGTFDTRTDWQTGLAPHSVFASDLDGDGDLDIVTANHFGNTVSVLKNLSRSIPSLSVQVLTFGDVLLGSIKRDSVTVTNTSVSTLTISSVTSDNGRFSVTPISASVAPLASQKFYIAFNPTSPLTETGNIVFTHNMPGSPDSVSIHGTGFLLRLTIAVKNRWNLISLPVHRSDSSVSSVFPTALSGTTYEYTTAYVPRDTLTPGKGYWTKFPAAINQLISGFIMPSIQLPLNQGWNLIGSIDHEVPAPSGGIISGTVFGFSNDSGYQPVTTLKPGKGYWVKAIANGSTTLGAGASPKVSAENFDAYSNISIEDNLGRKQTLYVTENRDGKINLDRYEMPPLSPLGILDVRFASGRMLEVIPTPNYRGDKKSQEFPIFISSAEYPITISWETKSQSVSAKLVINGKEIALTTNGTLNIYNLVSHIALKLSDAGEIPKAFTLEQNYPNPFNPNTIIHYSLPRNEYVTLRVYNVLGQEIATLVAGMQDAGHRSIEWDASGIASGVYFYRLAAGIYTTSKKMILMK